tara:strand:+ start:122 stop:463 length:342 start_codon:yes stop_codon:yes gene_type:complete
MAREVILGIHSLVILFIALGFPYGLLTNKPNFRKLHVSILGFVIFLMIFKIPCPLTILEKQFMDVSYEGTFIGYWMKQFIYIRWMPNVGVYLINLSFAILVFSSFFWYPIKKK